MVPRPLGLNCVAVAPRNAGHQVELLDLMGSDDHDMLAGSLGTFSDQARLCHEMQLLFHSGS